MYVQIVKWGVGIVVVGSVSLWQLATRTQPTDAAELVNGRAADVAVAPVESASQEPGQEESFAEVEDGVSDMGGESLAAVCCKSIGGSCRYYPSGPCPPSTTEITCPCPPFGQEDE